MAASSDSVAFFSKIKPKEENVIFSLKMSPTLIGTFIQGLKPSDR